MYDIRVDIINDPDAKHNTYRDIERYEITDDKKLIVMYRKNHKYVVPITNNVTSIEIVEI